MNLKTNYMGLELSSPVIVSSSKLTSTEEGVIKCAKAGAGAVVLKSLFEEQILDEINAKIIDNDMYFYYPEAMRQVQEISKEHGVNQYLKLISETKAKVKIPVFASINCISSNEWPSFASKIEEAGADGIELNIGILPLDSNIESRIIENLYVDIVTEVKSNTNLPVSVKIGSNFTNMTSFAKKLCGAGINGLVLFNRFNYPDIDIEKMEIVSQNYTSSPQEIAESLRWVGLLSSKVRCDIASSTGVHDSAAVIKQLLAGATVTQICSALYINGVEYIKTINSEIEVWMKKMHFTSLDDFRGKMSRGKENIAAFERVQFIKKSTDNG